MFLTNNTNTFSQQPTVGCPCDCDQIISSRGGQDIQLYRLGDCFVFDVTVTGCGDRTVYGFTLNFDIDPDNPCLNQNWQIRDGVTQTFMGMYNPVFDAPMIGFFNEPVQPCSSSQIYYLICPETNDCINQTLNMNINFIFAPGDPPCPPQPKNITFGFYNSISNDNVIEHLDFSQGVDYFELNNLLSMDGIYEIQLFDIHGKSYSVDYNASSNNIHIQTNTLQTGTYYGKLLLKGNYYRSFRINIIK